MSQIIKVWVDLLCSRCYKPIELGLDSNLYDKKVRESDDTEFCESCNDWIFPIVIMKREYDTRRIIGKGCQKMERDVKHGIEIIAIEGIGITENAGYVDP